MDGAEAALDGMDRAIVVMDEPVKADHEHRPQTHDAVELSLILVTHNSSGVLRDFIRSLKAFPPASAWQLVVFDNASGDDSVAMLRDGFAQALILDSSRNRGFAAAVNAAAVHACGRYYLLVNPDIAWQAGALDRLVGFLESRPRAAAVAPRLVFPDGRPQPSLRRFPTHGNIWLSRGAPCSRVLSKLFGANLYTLPDPEEAEPIEAAAAACLMVRAGAFREVGGMDEEYFLYVEDTDFCRRLSAAGWEIWIEPSVCVIHRWGGHAKRDPVLKAHHRRGIRRYFQKFHRRKRIRNGVLFMAFWLADAVGWLGRLVERRKG